MEVNHKLAIILIPIKSLMTIGVSEAKNFNLSLKFSALKSMNFGEIPLKGWKFEMSIFIRELNIGSFFKYVRSTEIGVGC